jgi:hypothetical protein
MVSYNKEKREMKKSEVDEKKEWEKTVIEEYLNYLKEKFDFVSKLKEMGRKEEPLLLCCCYIEGLGRSYFRKSSQESFYLALKHFGKQDIFIQIYPKMLWIGFQTKGLIPLASKIGILLKRAGSRVFTEEEIIELMTNRLSSEEMNLLKSNLWRGSFAAYAYKYLRNPNVHELGGTEFSFGNLTYKDEPVVIDFRSLYQAMINVFQEMKKISENTATLLGWDFESLKKAYFADDKEWQELESS